MRYIHISVFRILFFIQAQIYRNMYVYNRITGQGNARGELRARARSSELRSMNACLIIFYCPASLGAVELRVAMLAGIYLHMLYAQRGRLQGAL
jgi:hypothetical protein